MKGTVSPDVDTSSTTSAAYGVSTSTNDTMAGINNKDNTNSILRPRLLTEKRSNSSRRKASIDSQTGQPHHYHHRRHHHHDPTKGRSPSPPEGAQRHSVEQSEYKYNADGTVTPVLKSVEQTWSSFLIQHQLVLACSVVLAVFASHILIVSKEARDGHSVDWIASLSAIIPPPVWKSLPPSWTRVTSGDPAMIKKWVPKPGAFDPNQAWSSIAMALQYQTIVVDEITGQGQVLYGKGWNDIYMVMMWVMIWTAFREAAMTYFLIPLGQSFGVGEVPKKAVRMTESGLGSTDKVRIAQDTTKLKKEEHARQGKLLRFAEQGWLVIYDGCMWTFGMTLLYNSPYWSDSTYYWRDYPKTHLDATFKWYYLIQFAFWLQQLLLAILGIEKRRKDFLEFMIHHIITCLLIGFSYSFNLTSVGHAVLCAMDFSDIVLAVCKMLKYMHKDRVADGGFVLFVVTWIFSRHYYFGRIIWSCFVEAPKYALMGWDPSIGLYFTPKILQGFGFLLCSLYVILLFWLAMIVRVILKVLRGENSDDVRSEDEEETEQDTLAEEALQDEKTGLNTIDGANDMRSAGIDPTTLTPIQVSG